jgi:hypothetical protein
MESCRSPESLLVSRRTEPETWIVITSLPLAAPGFGCVASCLTIWVANFCLFPGSRLSNNGFDSIHYPKQPSQTFLVARQRVGNFRASRVEPFWSSLDLWWYLWGAALDKTQWQPRMITMYPRILPDLWWAVMSCNELWWTMRISAQICDQPSWWWTVRISTWTHAIVLEFTVLVVSLNINTANVSVIICDYLWLSVHICDYMYLICIVAVILGYTRLSVTKRPLWWPFCHTKLCLLW